MKKVGCAKKILTALGLPRAQQNDRSALTLLALCDIGRRTAWKKAQKPMLRILDIMNFMRDQYGKVYAPNSRETIRRQTIHQFEQARIIDKNPDDPDRPTNSGKTVYALTDEALGVLRSYGTPDFKTKVSQFVSRFGTLQREYRSSRAKHRVPLRTPGGQLVHLSPGKHNQLQAKVIEHFGPRFAPGATLLYVGDTALKHVIYEAALLTELGIEITLHDKLPDIILYLRERDWLYLVEVVTSHGPVSPKRHREIETLLCNCRSQRIYVTAFSDFTAFRKYAGDIAWETEVWVADNPDHVIHFNGSKFLGPYGLRKP